MPLCIKVGSTAQLVNQLASLRGLTKQDAVAWQNGASIGSSRS